MISRTNSCFSSTRNDSNSDNNFAVAVLIDAKLNPGCADVSRDVGVSREFSGLSQWHTLRVAPRVAAIYAMISFTTFPCTSVSRNSRPAYL
jgi:hypothetical protein